MKTLFFVVLLCTSSYSFADNSYCKQMPNGQSVCNTFRDDGSMRSDYWSAPINGQSYNTATFDTGSKDE